MVVEGDTEEEFRYVELAWARSSVGVLLVMGLWEREELTRHHIGGSADKFGWGEVGEVGVAHCGG